jgi:hypothetical protein
MSGLLWSSNGNVPPGFDDSYFYVFGIRKVVEYEDLLPETVYPPRYASLNYLSYNYLMASTAGLFRLTPDQVYEGSFLAGKLALLILLLRLLLSIEKDSLAVAGMLAALAPFSGAPEFHGFYWVVPSFWLLCLFFFWVSELADPTPTHGVALLLTGFLGGAIHPLGPYLVAPLGLFLLALRALDRNDPSWKRRFSAFFWISTGVLLAALAPNLLMRLPGYEDIGSAPPHAAIWLGGGWPELDSEGAAASDARTATWLPGFRGVFRSYLRFVLSPVLLLPLLGALGLLVHHRRFVLLALFLSTLSFTLGATVHPYASRTCLFLWPTTLVVLGAAPALGWRLASSRMTGRRTRLALASIAAATLVLLFAAWHAYNRTLIRASLRFSNARWDETCAASLLAETESGSDAVSYGSKYSASAFLARGLERRPRRPLSEIESAADDRPRDTIWAVLDDPETGFPLAEEKFRIVEALRERGFRVELRDCGVFVMAGFSRR